MTNVIPIIYWSKWFDLEQWEGYTIDNCNLNYTCKITHDQTQATDSSVLIFHASDINKRDFSFPQQQKNSAWVYHDAEAPHYQSLEVINKMQYSMTYRLDSDFPWGYFQGQDLLNRMERPPSIKKKEKASIAWIVSNCKASNYRHHYVKELLRYIDIDIYGHCLNNKDWPTNITSTIDLISKYHFYLAIENSNCKDYVTEKLTNTYLAGVIPIVDGPSDYGPFIPNTHSVIKLDDFNHPKELANYIHHVLNNKTLYNSYLDYRKPNGLSTRFKHTLKTYEEGQCKLCQLAYERQSNMNLYYPGKKIYLDNTCINSKHYSFKHSNTLLFYIPALLLILALSWFLLKKSRRFKKWTAVRTHE